MTIPDEAVQAAPNERAVVGLDGNAGYSLLGDDLQVGESEFVTVNYDKNTAAYICELRAIRQAHHNLETRLGRRIPFHHGPGHPYYGD